MRITHVVGARPNFMKMAPLYNSLKVRDTIQTIIHTGQHYDKQMSDVFFSDLQIPKPAVNLNIGSGSHAEQTGRVMMALEPILKEERPDLVVVYGDVNSTMAAAITCAKLLIKVAHVEAGLRSFDRAMPEEINRIVTDQLADLHFTPSEEANKNLVREGIDPSRIHLVGNVMIDTLVACQDKIRISSEKFGGAGEYGVVTIHRPSNVDDPKKLEAIVNQLETIAKRIPLVFPVHPRTKLPRRDIRNLKLIEPLGYNDFLGLLSRSKFVITDSGGIQEETTYLGLPCLTLRSNTERPITVELGTNVLVGENWQLLYSTVDDILAGRFKKGSLPPLWDGRAAGRIADIIIK